MWNRNYSGNIYIFKKTPQTWQCIQKTENNVINMLSYRCIYNNYYKHSHNCFVLRLVIVTDNKCKKWTKHKKRKGCT